MDMETSQTAAFFDLDGTLSEIYLWQGFFAHHQKTNFKRGALYSFIAFHLPLWLLYKLKLVSKDFFYKLHATNLAWLVKDVSIEVAKSMLEWVIENQILPNLRSEKLAEIQNHRSKGHKVFLISGSFTPVADKLAGQLGLHGAIATPLEIVDGRFTGKIIPPLNVGEGKIVRLQYFIEESGQDIDLSTSFFYADSIVDAPVLEIFGHPVALYPDKQIERLAKEQGCKLSRKLTFLTYSRKL